MRAERERRGARAPRRTPTPTRTPTRTRTRTPEPEHPKPKPKPNPNPNPHPTPKQESGLFVPATCDASSNMGSAAADVEQLFERITGEALDLDA